MISFLSQLLYRRKCLIKRGDQIVLVDPVTGELLNGDELDDDLKFDVETFNRKVITENFNRTVFTEICKDLNPFGDGKTLVLIRLYFLCISEQMIHKGITIT